MSFLALYLVGAQVFVVIIDLHAIHVVQLLTLGQQIVLTHVPTLVHGDA